MIKQNKVTGYPRKDIPDNKKNKEYHLKWCEAIESAINGGKSGIGNALREHFALMRMYGRGEQPQSLYKDYKFGEYKQPTEGQSDTDGTWNNPGSGAREGYQHLDYTVISPMPRIKDKLKGLLQGVDYDVYVDTIDDISGAQKEERKWKLWVQKEHGDFINQYKDNADIPYEEPNYLPSSIYELELFDQIGGFKDKVAKAMEKLIGHSYEISDWDNDLRDAVVDEYLDAGRCFLKIYLDPEDGKWKVKYIDILDAIIPYMKRYDNGTMPYAGHYEWMTIADLRIHLDMSEEKLARLAKRFCGEYGNPATTEWESLVELNEDGSYGYDTFRVKVMHIEWLDESQKMTMYHTNRYGNKSAFKIKDKEDYDSLSSGKKERVEVTNYRVLRQASWIVDSKEVFDWGLSNFMDRPTKNTVIPSYIYIKVNNKPVTERLKPVMDDVMVSWLKYQDGRAMAVKNGYAIDWSMIQNITDGTGKKFSEKEILEMWREDGILVFMQSMSGRYEGGGTTPVFPIDSGMGRVLEEAAAMWANAMNKIEDITGLSPVALGASPTNETATGTELSVAATADILKPLINKMLVIKEKTAGSLMRRIQLFCKTDYMDVYEGAVGKMDIERLRQALKGKTPAQFGMSFEAKPSEQMKQSLIKLIETSLNNRRQGLGGINEGFAAWAEERIFNGGNLKEMRMIISYQIERSQQEIERREKENIELQGQQNIALKQEEQKAQQMKTDAELAKIQAEGQTELQKVQAELMKDVLVDYMKEHPEEAKRFIGNQGTQDRGAVPEPPSPVINSNIPLEQESA